MLSLFINVHSFITLNMDKILFMAILINTFEILRFDFNINKYTLWSIVCYLYFCLHNGKFEDFCN